MTAMNVTGRQKTSPARPRTSTPLLRQKGLLIPEPDTEVDYITLEEASYRVEQ